MGEDVTLAGQAEAHWADRQSSWTRGWRRVALAAVPLAYLSYVAGAIGHYSRGAAAAAGYAILAAFACSWFIVIAPQPVRAGSRFWTGYALLTALFLAELRFAHAAAFVLCVFLTIMTVARLGARSAPIVIALALAALLVPVAITSWKFSLAAAFGTVTPVAIPIVALVMFGAMQVIASNQALAQARSDLAMLAAENERIRIARDLHDLLGHSLTTITVKAGLARRLGTADPQRALAEIGEVEELARRSLADVRAAVTNYREVTLTGELATGRELLRAAGITSDLPRAADVVDAGNQELFGWVVREGLTNVVRHSRASSCAVRLTARSVEITDDGAGPASSTDGSAAPSPTAPGSGLRGLRERVTAAGGLVEAGPVQPRGWRLLVTVGQEGG